MYFFLLMFVFVSVFPFYWMLTGATNSSVDITKGIINFGGNLKENWNNLQSTANIFLICANTIKITLIYTCLLYTSPSPRDRG